MLTELQINAERYWQLLMTLAEITDPDKPFTRRSFSERFSSGREWLTTQMQAAGMDTRIDYAGNLIGRLPGNGSAQGIIAIGSHSDTVPSGGRFDGIAGVIAGLECVLSWRERGLVFNHDIEVIDYLAEEPSEWGISCIGSRGITGFLDESLLATKHPDSGETLADAIVRMGGSPDLIAKRQDIVAAFELHIEQGQVLETERLSVGVVSGIVGIIRLEVTLQGQSNHAGTTPMSLRHDALCAGAEVILQAETLARQLASDDEGYFVATCGQVFPQPNASNVIAGECRLVFDIRSDNKALLERFVDKLHTKTQTLCAGRSVQCVRWARLTDTIPVNCDTALMRLLSAAASAQQISMKVMPSGAGHDAAFMAHIAPMAMVFVPSKAGKSHCPEEWTEAEDLAKGVSVLADAVQRFDNQE